MHSAQQQEKELAGSSEGKVLIVDDEISVRRALHASLLNLGFDVADAGSGEEAIALCRIAGYDAVLLDIELPGKKGIETCAELHRISPDTRILMLSVTDDEERKVEALEAGADDYVTKPVRIRELTARLRAVLRRARASSHGESIRIGDIALDSTRRIVQKLGAVIHLTPNEFTVLRYLMAHSGVPVTHSSLIRALGNTESGQVDYIRGLVYHLRKKLEDDYTAPRYLLTESHIGYRFVDPLDWNGEIV